MMDVDPWHFDKRVLYHFNWAAVKLAVLGPSHEVQQQGDSAAGRLCLWSWFVNIYIHDLTTLVLSGGQRPLYLSVWMRPLSLSVWMSLVTCVQFNSLRTSVIKGRTQKLHKKFRLSKPTDITRKLLMGTFWMYHFFHSTNVFSEFSQKTLLIFPGHIFITTTRYIWKQCISLPAIEFLHVRMYVHLSK
jgi:hypothetical protein